MGTANEQGELWNLEPEDWTLIQEPLHQPLWDAMLDRSGVVQGTRFLDVGCGGGGASLLAARRGALVSGIDAAQGLVALACRRVSGGDFRIGDIESLPFEEGAFEVVFAANSIQYAADRLATLLDFRRVCAAGGRIAVGLFGPPETVAFSQIQRAVRDALPEPPAGAGPYELSAPGKLESLIEKAGFTIVESGQVDCPFRYPTMEAMWRGLVSAGPNQRALRVVGEAKLQALVYAALDGFLTDDGAVKIAPNLFKFVVASN